MNRRAFITVLGGAAAWPLAARAQQGERLRRIGVLLPGTDNDQESLRRLAAFRQRLQELGWSEGRNVQVDTRWPGVRVQNDIAELVALAPDVIFCAGSSVLARLLQQTRTVPIVFVQVFDPVAGGFVSSLARPGGNATGFVTFEYVIAGKWITLLREIAPNVKRITVVQDPLLGVSAGLVGAAQAVSSVLGMQLTAATVRDATEIEASIDAAAREQSGGLLVIPGPATTIHLERIIALAARHRLPTVYPYRYMASAGGLISYGPELMELDREAASYVDRILRGERPGELPVQTPTKYRLVINLATAKALGLTIAPTLWAQADEVIE
jgi:ABC-type uncharacterized transport system substrate-binding protein